MCNNDKSCCGKCDQNSDDIECDVKDSKNCMIIDYGPFDGYVCDICGKEPYAYTENGDFYEGFYLASPEQCGHLVCHEHISKEEWDNYYTPDVISEFNKFIDKFFVYDEKSDYWSDKNDDEVYQEFINTGKFSIVEVEKNGGNLEWYINRCYKGELRDKLMEIFLTWLDPQIVPTYHGCVLTRGICPACKKEDEEETPEYREQFLRDVIELCTSVWVPVSSNKEK